MKKNLLYIIPVLLPVLLLSCNREEIDAPADSFDLTVHTRMPGWTEEDGSKVTFEGSDLAWSGTEDAALLIGDASGYVSATLTSQSKYPGAFSGRVSPGSYTLADLKAIVTPASCASMAGGKVAIAIPAEQTQKTAGALEWAPLWRGITQADLVARESGKYSVEGLALQWGAAVLQFNIYGRQTSQNVAEVLKGVILETEGRTLEGKALCTSSGTDFDFENGTGRLSVSLQEDVRLSDKTSATGVKLFAIVLPRAEKGNEAVQVTRVTVQTDLANYVMNPGKQLVLKAGEVHRIGLDMSKFPLRQVAATYSTDGGTTWTEALPSRFATLTVKGYLSRSTLERIAAAVKVQASTSEVDLSQCEYESSEFPDVFMATSEQPDRRIKGILFPANITSLAQSAFDYCAALEYTDLTGMQKLGAYAFRGTALRNLTVPSTVTEMPGQYHFGYCYNLETLYFDAPIPSDGNTHHYFSMRNQGDNPLNGASYPLVVTLGPHASLTGQEFDTNQKVVKVIFEGSDVTLGPACMIRCRNIETFDCSTLPTPPTMTGTSTGNMVDIGATVSGKRRILIPEGSLTAYAAALPWSYLVSNNGYEFEEVPFEFDSKVEWSEDGTTWSKTLPEAFTKLYARGELAAADLVNLAATIRETGLKVDLDLSGATLGTDPGAAFPAVFHGTEENPFTLLGSIKFPSNVKEISKEAFDWCTALESIDLTGITTINDRSFQHTGLKNLVIPSTVTAINGQYAFGYCWQLETVYFDSPTGTASGVNPHTFSCRNTNAVADLPDEYKKDNLIPLEFTFGPNAVQMRSQDFDTNHKLVKMIFKRYPEYFGNSWIVRCRYIETFDLSAAPLSPTATNANTSNMALVGDLVPAGRPKQIIVPAGEGDAFAAVQPWKYLVESRGYVIVDPHSEDPDDPDAVQYSANGGASWSTEIPDTFTSLSVKGNLTAAILSDIKSALDDQTGGASLDLSAATYSTTMFPKIFAGTETEPYMKLKGIKFPSNVITLAAQCFSYCKGLESADLTGLQSLSATADSYYYAFADTGLKSIVIPETLTGAMERSFVNTFDLESIYWNTPWDSGATSQNWRTFQWGRGNSNFSDANNPLKSKDLVLNIGAGAVAIPRNAFRNNHNLVRVVVEAGAGFTFLNNCFVNCDNLSVIELRGATPPAIMDVNIVDAATTCKKVPAADRKLIIPHGATAAYAAHENWANWATIITTLGLTLEEADE